MLLSYDLQIMAKGKEKKPFERKYSVILGCTGSVDPLIL